MTSRVIDTIILFVTKRFCMFQWPSGRRHNFTAYLISTISIAEYLLREMATNVARSISYMEHF